MTNDVELRHLRRCGTGDRGPGGGDEPFGSVLVAANGTVLAEDHNRVASGDRTRHPEFELARWAAANMTPGERAAATVFTSGEHCPMCAAAHGWVGLGRIVYASSSEQLVSWLAEPGVPAPPVRTLPIREVVPDLVVEGPIPGLAEQVRPAPSLLQLKSHPEASNSQMTPTAPNQGAAADRGGMFAFRDSQFTESPRLLSLVV